MNTCFILFLGSLFLQPFLARPFSFNISNFRPGVDYIIYSGDASIVNGSIDLVNSSNMAYRVGHASYGRTINLWNTSTGKPPEFTSHFSFTVDKTGENPFSDGFVFFIAPLSYQFPVRNSSGGYLGLFNSSITTNQIVVVEFDTFPNPWDPPFAHVGINNGSLNASTFVKWNVGLISGRPADAWISYNGTTRNLSVVWTYPKDADTIENSSVSYIIDLKQILPQQVRIGFSASTGVFYQHNFIHSWQFDSNMDLSEVRIPTVKRKLSRGRIGIVVGVICFVIGMVMIGFFVARSRRIKKASKNAQRNRTAQNDLETVSLPKRFRYRELETSTNSFSDHGKLGKGGSGQVYKGMFIGRLIAVKRISPEFVNSEKIFINEVKIISRLIHRNLVQFIGWCHEKGKFLLVYEFMPNGSLDTHLFGNDSVLPWQVRYKIALDMASALHYLHEDAEHCVIHRDIKSANVLLDIDFNAKIGDFGVAKVVDPQLRTQVTGIVGTYGYLAPEYAYEGKASKESDMFSFGIVALELASGKRIHKDGDYYMPLAKWVWELHLAGEILDAADDRLNSDFNREEMEILLKVGLWCAHPKDKERPKAGQVIKFLRSETSIPDLPDDAHNIAFPVQPTHLLQNESAIQPISSSIHLGR